MRRFFYLVCVLILLLWAIPQLTFSAGVMEMVFSGAWMIFALLAIGGNLTGILYYSKKRVEKSSIKQKQQPRKRQMQMLR
ncbi:hypothetical protein [Metabacillus arenae]|uniref:Uncharacterized protein n=1 Tax=Metabacillus arenae TaxID=2771434 RepID=A0A926NEM6_9BACI|nr:hypothetical protein [Metabacillus arenae]MBD1380109.1 hypothetical protein [Metabacillus arenae]